MTRRTALAGGLASAGLLAACGSPDIDDTGLSDTPSGRFIDVDGARLHYRIEGRGPKAIALHGASGNLLDWTAGPASTIFSTNQVLMFDRPGLGFSPRPARGGVTLSDQAALMRKAAGQLGFGRATVIGHSFGGSVALAWAVDAPRAVDGLVLLAAPSQEWPGGVGAIYSFAANPVTGPALSRVLPAIASERLITNALARVFAPQSPPPGYADRVGPELALKPANIQANAAQLTALKPGIRAMVPRYDRLTMPVEILHGTADRTVSFNLHSASLAAQLPSARLTQLDGIGHMPHHSAPRSLNAALTRINRA